MAEDTAAPAETTEQSTESPEQPTESAPVAEKAAPQSPAEAIRKYKVKVDGEDIEVDETELVREYQLRKASDKKFQDASQLKKQADALVNLLREDPISALTHPSVGHDFRKIAEKYLADQLEDELASPEEREKTAKLRRLEKLEKENEELRSAEENRKNEALKLHFQQSYETGILEALDKSGLPKTNHTVKRMAYYLNRALEHDYELEPKDVVDLVRQDYMNEVKNVIGASDGQILLDLLGEETALKIRKYDVSRLKEKQTQQPAKKEEIRETPGKKMITRDDFDKYLLSIKD